MKVKLVKELDSLNVGELYKVIGIKKEVGVFHYKILFSENNKLKTMWVSKEVFTYPLEKFSDRTLPSV